MSSPLPPATGAHPFRGGGALVEPEDVAEDDGDVEEGGAVGGQQLVELRQVEIGGGAPRLGGGWKRCFRTKRANPRVFSGDKKKTSILRFGKTLSDEVWVYAQTLRTFFWDAEIRTNNSEEEVVELASL